MTARIFQLNRSPGGVPKLPVREVHIGALGLDGDRHAHPKVHGGPERAVCLFSLELIQALQAEGHAIFPGSTGENVTISGLTGTVLAPGVRLQLGDEVILAITRDTDPCKLIAGSFIDGAFRRLDHKLHPGTTRWYARVEREGRVRIGQAIRIL